MKNYYDILEVSPKASKEVIEKAYKVLIKKYHPDTHNPDTLGLYDKYIKEINEAYDVLSNNFLREQYDKELKIQNEINETPKNDVENRRNEENLKLRMKRKQKQEKNENYNQEVIEPGLIGLLRLVFRKRKIDFEVPKDEEERKKTFIAIGLTAVIIIGLGIILYVLPFTHNWMVENFIDNPLVQGIKNIFR